MRGGGRSAVLAIIGAVAAGLLTGSGAVAADVDLRLAYTCAFPSGEQPVPVRVVAGFPDSAIVRQPFQPTGVAITMTLPPAAVADLTALGAATVSASADLTVAVSDSGVPGESLWSVPVAATPVPPDGELELVATGDVLSAFPNLVGELTLTAAALTVFLSPQREDGSGTDPPFVVMTCVLDEGQDALLATVPVVMPPQPPGTPEECGDIPPFRPGLDTGCSFAAGYANVAKLGGSVRIEPGLMNIALNDFEFGEGNLLFQHNVGDMPAGGFPPSTATFLTFGFMPIRATMELTQVGPIPVEIVAQGGPPFLYWISATAAMSLRVRDVTVNGVPLDVGPQCRSAEPMTVELVGGTPEYTNIFRGGPLQGIATIPPFSGCGVGEDLDPLFTGTVSGPGNYISMRQGTMCTPIDPGFCPPVVEEPPG